MKQHVIPAALLWAVLTAISEGAAYFDRFPVVGSTQAEDFDWIFQFLMYLGIPVLTFVISVVAYCFLRFGSRQRPAEDGPPIMGRGTAPRVWIAITGSLTLFVMIFPGLTGLAQLQGDRTGYGWGDPNAQVVIKATGFRWQWAFDYPAYGVQVNIAKGKELVLPVDTNVKFELNSTDVIHSLWIPAFRMRIDAIPGRQTFFTVKPTMLGSSEENPDFRIQCSMLCGLDHSTMKFPVRVVPQEEFLKWIETQKAAK